MKIVRHRKDFEAWLEAVENQELADQMNGVKHPDLKLVMGKSNRVWSNKDEAAKLLEFFEVDPWEARKMIGPAGAEELCKGRPKLLAELEKLIVKPPGKPTLVESSDKRLAMVLNPLNQIEDLGQPGSELI